MVKARLVFLIAIAAGLASGTNLFASPPPAPFPVFLRQGFSSVLEFPEAPARVVLGDSESFQVERLDKSLVIRTHAAYATSNLFVYFAAAEPKLFILTASEDAEPTYFKRFDPPVKKILPEPRGATTTRSAVPLNRGARTLKTEFDDKKDYLLIEVELTANHLAPIRPNWDLVRLTYSGKVIKPHQLWAERKEVQKDAKVKARFVFTKPNIPKNLKGVTLVIPSHGEAKAFSLHFGAQK